MLFGRSWALAILCAATFVSLPTAHADVSVATGPTTIPRGDATAARDITIGNDVSALAIAVDTAPPWGVARGGIVDIAIVRDGEPGFDIASLADFMPNNWCWQLVGAIRAALAQCPYRFSHSSRFCLLQASTWA